MKKLCCLVAFLLVVQGGSSSPVASTNADAVLHSLLSNQVTPRVADSMPLEDLTVVIDEWRVVHLSHLHLTLSLDPRNLQVNSDFSSSTIRFSCAGDYVNVFGNFKLQNSSTFLAKGSVNVSLVGLDVSGVSYLLLYDECISAHDSDLKYLSHGTEAKFTNKNKSDSSEMDNVPMDIFLREFMELVHDDVVHLAKEKILASLNSALCSVSMSTLLGGQEEEHSYRKRALQAIPHLNEIIDTVMENMKPVIHSQGLDVFSLNDINTTFTVKELIFKLHGAVLAENGSMTNLTSVRRTSDCMLAGNGSLFLFSGGFGMDVFNVTYDNIDATFEDIEFTGKISVSFKAMSIRFKALMVVINSTCYPSLDYIHVNKLDRIRAEVEGYKAWLVEDIILMGFAKYKHRIILAVDAMIGKLSDAYLKGFDCGNYFGTSNSFLTSFSNALNK